MNLLQYSFVLDSDHDMDEVRRRVAAKRHVVDGLPGLRWKAWLLSEPLPGLLQLKTYAPLYLFDTDEAVAAFLAGPVYQGVTDAFGWTRPLFGLTLGVIEDDPGAARSVTLTSEPLRHHEALRDAVRAVHPLAQGEVAQARMLVPGTMSLLTYRFWRAPPREHAGAEDRTVYDVVAISRGGVDNRHRGAGPAG